MNCIDVMRVLITEHQLQSARFSLIEHFVGINWRVKYSTTRQKINNLHEGLIQHKPLHVWEICGEEILSDDFRSGLLVSHENHVISVSSKIKIDEKVKHIAMMNLHPKDGVSYDDTLKILEAITEGLHGYLLKSGRYYHFYGNALLDTIEWIQFMAQFLMPTIILSPRYVGHCLYRGYAALRITTEPKFKPMLPTVCDVLGRNLQRKNY